MHATTEPNAPFGSTTTSSRAYYIDSASLRQNVQRAVNRGESYHQLRRTISYANYGKLRFGTEYEQHLWSECSRLIANCIIF
jgi:TnpA family transposase